MFALLLNLPWKFVQWPIVHCSVAGVEGAGTVGPLGGLAEGLGAEAAGGAGAEAFLAIGGKSVDDTSDGTG